MPAPLLIADVPWLLYRSYFALPKSITDGEGSPVNALLGTVNALLSCEEQLAPEGGVRAIVACMGAEQAAYRVALYPPYHAHRDPMPPELAGQWQRAPELLQSLGFIYANTDELEADDLLYSYARTEVARGGEALDADRRPRPVRRGHRRGAGARAAARRRRRTRGARGGGPRATASSRARSPTSSPCAATPPTGSRERPGSGPRRRPSCSAPTTPSSSS